MTRKDFLSTTGKALLAGGLLSQFPSYAHAMANSSPTRFFDFSLAQWSLRNHHWKGGLKHVEFPAYTQEKFGIQAVEYVSSFFEKGLPAAELVELKQRVSDLGMSSVLIMVDIWNDGGKLASPKKKRRVQAVDNHKAWVEAAQFLGCHSIRVNAHGAQDADRQDAKKHFADGLSRLVEFSDTMGINIVVENHGGYSSDGAWLAEVMEMVDHPRCGTLPDFGNFTIDAKTGEKYDPYLGVKELMPFAKGVSAKSLAFDASGEESTLDYLKLMKIVREAGYEGLVGIEWGGKGGAEEADQGILATKHLLEKVRGEL
ncbi:MAG: sugar phosphate isomerase/epimerase family protein [Bacteroidota bacterium]